MRKPYSYRRKLLRFLVYFLRNPIGPFREFYDGKVAFLNIYKGAFRPKDRVLRERRLWIRLQDFSENYSSNKRSQRAILGKEGL